MKGNRAVAVAVVAVVLLLAGWWLFKRGGTGGAVDLLDHFDRVEKRPSPGVFQVHDVEIDGVNRRSVAISPVTGSRLIWRHRIPDDAWLQVYLGLLPEAWDQEGNGVLFLIGVSDGRTFETLVEQHVNPFANKGDRKWIPVMVDLSAYAGEDIELILNTYSGPPGEGDDHRADLAVWGAPEIVVR